MFDIGFSEMVLLAAIALIAIGPKQLPEVARVTGRLIGDLKRTTAEFTRTFLEARETTTEILNDTNRQIVDAHRQIIDNIIVENQSGASSPVPPAVHDPSVPANPSDYAAALDHSHHTAPHSTVNPTSGPTPGLASGSTTSDTTTQVSSVAPTSVVDHTLPVSMPSNHRKDS